MRGIEILEDEHATRTHPVIDTLEQPVALFGWQAVDDVVDHDRVELSANAVVESTDEPNLRMTKSEQRLAQIRFHGDHFASSLLGDEPGIGAMPRPDVEDPAALRDDVERPQERRRQEAAEDVDALPGGVSVKGLMQELESAEVTNCLERADYSDG